MYVSRIYRDSWEQRTDPTLIFGSDNNNILMDIVQLRTRSPCVKQTLLALIKQTTFF